MKSNPSPTIEKILEEFKKEFVGDDKLMTEGSLNQKKFESFLTDKLQEVERETRQQALKELLKKSYVRNAKPADDYERGYDHGYDDKTVELQEKLSGLKSGEEKTE